MHDAWRELLQQSAATPGPGALSGDLIIDPPSAPDHTPTLSLVDFLQVFLGLHVPQGFKSEFFQLWEEIIVTSPPDGAHRDAVARFARAVARRADGDLYVGTGGGLITPTGRFVPAATVAPVGCFRDQQEWSPPTDILLVLEITAANPLKERDQKRLGYAAAGIPCYLLVDRDRERITLFTEPEDGEYTVLTETGFGQSLDLPAPFSFTLDTAPLR
ncbi:Uma2 family endonuclease [Kitasatospora sp. NPDC051170]|uniref:Uma2 family endonuclease n=1 Tax=Kitasatospora sp. NPDC051170 TaxID=3364056 RepID=UPI0037A38BD0